jgi:hypothetical protein
LCDIAEPKKLTRLPREAGSTSPFLYSIESGSLCRRKEQLELCQEHEVVGSRIFRRKKELSGHRHEILTKRARAKCSRNAESGKLQSHCWQTEGKKGIFWKS